MSAPETGAATPPADRWARQAAGARLLAAGGVLGGVLASSCCIVPLVLVTLGVGGAWIGNLTALAPYKPYFLGATALFLGAGFWLAYGRAGTAKACPAGPGRGRPASVMATRAALWTGTVLALLAATVGCWAPLFY